MRRLNLNKNLYEFPVALYGTLEQYNEVLSRCRCRTFYKYENRNGTYISDEFADKLLSSVAYTPVKGIYTPEDNDYSDHGSERDEGRIYGIVPENPRIAWETHLDEDGVERLYACVDVLIFTSLYKEANEIIGKSQSMELFGPSLKYHEGIIGNQRYIIFDEGCFLGLQVLGDRVEPCFEGASFYTLQNTIQYAINQIKKYGGNNMHTDVFKLSDDEKYNKLFELLNPECSEKGTVKYIISKVFDEYALAYDIENGDYYRAYYTKNDEIDMIELGEMVKCYVVDITENEKDTLDTLRVLNGNTYELVSDVLTNAQENKDLCEQYSAKIVELSENITTLETEKENYSATATDLQNQLDAAQDNLNSVTEELNSLKEYKAQVELQEKESIVNEYTNILAEEILEKYRLNIADYNTEELDMRLAYEVKKNNSSVFQAKTDDGYRPKEVPLEGIDAILAKYKKD